MAVERVELTLVIESFDGKGMADGVVESDPQGIERLSLDQLGTGAPNIRKLYVLNRECARDIPERGKFYSFKECVHQRIEVASFDPRCVVIAVACEDWIGMTSASNHLEQGFMHEEMTGAVAFHRGRGLSSLSSLPLSAECGHWAQLPSTQCTTRGTHRQSR